MSNGGNAAATPATANISQRRMIECIVSAGYWANHLNLYAEKMQVRADRYTIVASLISVVTGLSAWGAIAAKTGWWAQALVGVMAFAAAAVSVIPKVRGYGECAIKAAPLATEYGAALGMLEDAVLEMQSDKQEQLQSAQIHARQALNVFDSIRAKKNALRPFPTDLAQDITSKREELIRQQEALVTAPKN
ncbi:MAG TPA: hypothetical protein VN577_17830 [Terriglobales bacterium]|nr:hypothetical protein [Terriglobales bacterium]